MKKFNFFSLTVVLAVALFAVSCNNNKTAEKAEVAAVETTLDVDSLLANAPEFVNDTVTVEAVCTHICAHGGGKIFLMGSDDTKTIRCEAGEEIGAFKQECVNSIVKVNGVLVEERMDEAALLQWEEQLKAQTAEKHGNGEGGCDSDKKARQEEAAETPEERIANFRKRIAERNEKEGINYLSFYFIKAISYEIVNK